MIERLQNKNIRISNKIKVVFQLSYAIEAKLLNATDFPPLKRKLESYVNSNNDFFGYLVNEQIAGVIEVKHTNSFIHIQSLVVHPNFFRKGIGRKLMNFVLNSYTTDLFIVETGVDNGPAIALYRQLNFAEVKQWDTDIGIRKIKFEKKTNNQQTDEY